MKTLIQFILLQLVCFSLQSQNLYQRTYGTPNTDESGHVVMATEDGGALLLNRISNSNSASYDIQLLKIDENGEILSQKTYETPDQEDELQMLGLPSGDYIIGASVSLRTGGSQIRLLRVESASHNIVWAENYAINSDELRDMTYGEDGSIVLLTNGESGELLTAFDQMGNQTWEMALDLEDYFFTNIEATIDGGYALSGNRSNQEGQLLYKTDNRGNKEWEKLSDNGVWDSDRNYALIQTSDGGYLSLGVDFNDGTTRTVIRNEPNGDNSWLNIIGDNDFSRRTPWDILETSNGLYIFVSSSFRDAHIEAMNSNGQPLWSVAVDYGRTEAFQSVTQLSNGNLLASGTSDSFGGTGEDILLVAFSLEGEELWSKTYGEVGDSDVEWAYSLTPASSGEYLLLGSKEIVGSTQEYAWSILNVNRNDGSLNWSKNYHNNGGENHGYIIKPIETGGYALYGAYDYNDPEINTSSMALTKIDESGEIIWTQIYDSFFGFSTSAMEATSDGGFILSGRSKNDMLQCIKTDVSGNIEWEKTYEDSRNGYGLKELEEGGYLLFGEQFYEFDGSTGTSSVPFVAKKIDEKGELIWSQSITDGSSIFFRCFNAVETQDGGYAMVGYKYDVTNDLHKMYLLKLTKEGEVAWQKDINDDEDYFRGYDIVETEDGDLIFVGTRRFDSHLIAGQGFLLKTDADGNEIWRKYYGSDLGPNAFLYNVHQNEDGSLALTGYIDYQNSLNIYFLTTDSEGNTMTVNVFAPSLQYNFQIAPNPNNGQFQLSFEGNIGGENLQLSILDLAGRQLEDRAIPPISQQVDLSHLPSGTYFVKLGNGQQFSTKRVVVE